MEIGEVIYENGPVTLKYAGEKDGEQMGTVVSVSGESAPIPIVSVLARGGWNRVVSKPSASSLEQWF